jgi:hypothetical protein
VVYSQLSLAISAKFYPRGKDFPRLLLNISVGLRGEEKGGELKEGKKKEEFPGLAVREWRSLIKEGGGKGPEEDTSLLSLSGAIPSDQLLISQRDFGIIPPLSLPTVTSRLTHIN